MALHEWSLIQYKEVQRNKRRETEDVRVIVDESKRTLKVLCGIEEVEVIYCNMNVAKYPSLKMKGELLFVLTNRLAQGFRLKFHDKDRNQFLTVMRRVCFISETPEKNHLNRTFTNTDRWNQTVTKMKIPISSSQPISYSDGLRSSPRKVARNLSCSFKSMSQERSRTQSNSNSSVTYYSQPASNNYQRPQSSSSSISSSISSAHNAVYGDLPISFSQASNYSSCMSPYSSDSLKSPFSNSQCSDHFQPYTNVSSPDFSYGSPRSSDQLMQLSPVKLNENKSVQTDSNLIDKLIENPSFVNSFLMRITKDKKLGNLVKAMRAQLRKVSPDVLKNVQKKTNRFKLKRRATTSTNRPPPLIHLGSDAEQDPFV